MATCETCRFWVTPDALAGGFGKCQYARERWEVQNVAFEPPNKPRHEYDDWDDVERIEVESLANMNAIVIDGSGYHAELLTKPCHYCSEHKPRSTPTNISASDAPQGEF